MNLMNAARLLLAAGILAAALPAWTPAPGGKPQKPAPKLPPKVHLRHYALQASREAFTACDLDRDDRITFREARKTLGTSTAQAFALWDTDRDGWIHFPEFDARYRKLVREGWGLTLEGPARARAPKDPPPPTPLPLKKLFQTLDRDGDGRVAPAEWRGTTQALGAALARIPQGFFGLDRNRDGLLELRELAPLAAFFPGRTRNQPPPPPVPTVLPPHLQGADRNGDQHLDLRELELLFQKLDPGLAPWAPGIFRKVDKNGDGLLSPRELRALPALQGDRKGKKAPGKALPRADGKKGRPEAPKSSGALLPLPRTAAGAAPLG